MWRTFVAVVLVAAAFSVLFFGALKLNSEQELGEITADLEARTSLAVRNMEVRLDAAGSDVALAASSPAVLRFLRDDSPENERMVADLFAAMATTKTAITSMRLVDVDGYERVHLAVDGEGGIRSLPEQELQRVGEMERMHSAFLERGEIFVSPFDVLRENGAMGEAVTPMQPIVVLAASVFNGEEHGGTLVVMLDGNFLIEQLESSVGPVDSFMLGADGGWLATHDEERAWSTARGLPSFADEYPEAWAGMQSTRGSAVSEFGAYAFATGIPERYGVVHGTDTIRALIAQQWKIVASVPIEGLPSAGLDRSPLIAAGFFVGLGVAGFTTLAVSRLLEGRRMLRRSIRDGAVRLAAIQNTLGEGLVVMDREGRIVEANPQAERMLGCESGALVGANAHELFHETSGVQASDECPMLRVVRTGVTFRSEDEVFRHRDGSGLHVGVSAAPLVVDGRIEGAVIVFRDITDIRAYQQEIRELAFRDEVTGLPNRRVFADRLDLAIANADRRAAPVAVMFLDLDDFKRINDDYGHDVGDAFLRAIAGRIAEGLRGSDTLARYGGDEFVVLLPEVNGPEEAEAVAHRILGALGEPIEVGGFMLRASSSIGIALRMDGEDAETLLASADAAMYEAKQAGPGRFSVSRVVPQSAR